MTPSYLHSISPFVSEPSSHSVAAIKGHQTRKAKDRAPVIERMNLMRAEMGMEPVSR